MGEREIKNIFWKPERENEEILGVFLGLREGLYGLNGVLELENGEILYLPANKVLEEKLRFVRNGELIRVRYNGEKKGQNGRIYKDFSVFVREG